MANLGNVLKVMEVLPVTDTEAEAKAVEELRNETPQETVEVEETETVTV